MGTTSRLRLRRSAAQMHALVQVEREIRANDQHSRRKYLREFTEAYTTYEQVLEPQELTTELLKADIILIGDYHALPKSQTYAADVIELLARHGRTVALGLEMVFARDQHIVEEWEAGDINEAELRQRIRYDQEWGYDWTPFGSLMRRARDSGAHIYGLDCMPRGDLRRIGARDRHAAEKIGQICTDHPDTALVVLFGESHLAPQHLPALVKRSVPGRSVLTVLQNVDSLYWQASGEPGEAVQAVKVAEDVICVFNASPLEKYESYRLCIERWRCEKPGQPDLAPTYYNVVDALLSFLRIDKYQPIRGQHGYLVDHLPEVCSAVEEDGFRRALMRAGVVEPRRTKLLDRWRSAGSCYVAECNRIYVRQFELATGAEEAADFLCAMAWEPAEVHSAFGEDTFYRECLRIALQSFAVRVLCPGRPAVRESALYSMYSLTREEVEEATRFSYREYMRMLDFVALHKDFEVNARRYRFVPELILEGRAYTNDNFDFVVRWLGRLLGSQMYDAYLHGVLHRRTLRSLFLHRHFAPGMAKAQYFRMARLSGSRRQLVS